jgi:hypothetical protein
MRLRWGLGRTDRAQWLASRPAGAPSMGGWCRDRVRCVDEIAVVAGRVEEESVGRRMWILKQRLWKRQVDYRKLSAFETCRRTA